MTEYQFYEYNFFIFPVMNEDMHLLNVIIGNLIQYTFLFIDWYLPPGALASKFQVWIMCNDYLGSAKPAGQVEWNAA